MKSRRLRWLDYKANMARNINISVRNPEGKDHFGKLDISGRIILKWVPGNWNVTM
jgi:hypothetical protein